MRKPDLLIVGGSSTALEIRECAEIYYKKQYSTIFNVIGDNESSELNNIIHDRDLNDYLKHNDLVSCIIGFTNKKLRKFFNDKFIELNVPYTNIIHPTAVVYPSARIGNGNYVGPSVVISSNAIIGNGCLINIGVSIGHDAVIGNNCILNPGVRISGHCRIGDNTLLGANSFVFQNKSIGADCAIDALTYIDRNIEDKQICSSNIGVVKIYPNRY